MNRLTIGIILSFAVILSITAMNFIPKPSAINTNQVGCNKSTFGCSYEISFEIGESRKNCKSNYTKSCCKKEEAKACGPDCTKQCCAKT